MTDAREAPDRIIAGLSRLDQDLPTLPSILAEVSRLTSSDDSSAADLVRVVVQDQALTARVLRAANSAYYGLRDKISTLDRAVVVLGFDMIRSLALGASVVQVLSSFPSCPEIDLPAFWLHAAAVAVFTEDQRAAVEVSPGEAFTAGLLHDIGKIIMLVYFEDDFRNVVRRARKDGLDFHEAELAEIGLGHDFVAGQMLRRWGLPSGLAEAVRLHHQPMEALSSTPLAARVHLADFAARALKIGFSGAETVKPLSPDFMAALGLKKDNLRQRLEDMAKAVPKVLSLAAALT